MNVCCPCVRKPWDTRTKMKLVKIGMTVGIGCMSLHLWERHLVHYLEVLVNGRIQETPKPQRCLGKSCHQPPLAGDEKSNPNHKTPMTTEPVDITPEPTTQGNKQLKMDQFLTKDEEHTRGSTEKTCQPTISKSQPLGTSSREQLLQQTTLQILQNPEQNRNYMPYHRHSVPFYAQH